MKRCPRCKQEKPLEEFNRRRETEYQTYCRLCDNLNKREHYQKNKDYYKEKAQYRKHKERLKYEEVKSSTPCSDCGQCFHFAAMQYDHLPGSVKCGNVATLVGMGVSVQVSEEIAKCELVCANCHSIRTWSRKQRKEVNKPSLRSSEDRATACEAV